MTEVAMFEDCLVTGAAGDALGAEVEFASWRQIQPRPERSWFDRYPGG